jgi:hypothetical protein
LNTNLSEIGFVLDRSGSMNAMKEEAIGGTLSWNLSRNFAERLA